MTLRRSIPWVILSVGFFIALDILFASSAFAQSGQSGIISANCSGLYCQLCNLFALADSLIKYAIYIAVPIGGAVFAYAGFLFITSGGSTESVSKAKGLFADVIIGFILVLLAFLIVDTIIQSLASGTFTGASWRGVSCVARNINDPWISPTTSTSPISVVPGSSGTTLAPGSAATIAAAAALAAAADNGQGLPTAAGPSNGDLACVWVINQIMTAAGVAPFTTENVFIAEQQLQAGRGTRVTDQSQAKAGDLVVITQGTTKGHMGICMNDGCSSVRSNSSSNARFNWVSDVSFSPSYTSGPGRIYRIN